jgi:hypothetical protein
LGIAAMDCNDGSIKDFVGYKYPTYACLAVCEPILKLLQGLRIGHDGRILFLNGLSLSFESTGGNQPMRYYIRCLK